MNLQSMNSLRISSEAPEVVPGQPAFLLGPTYVASADGLKRGGSGGSQSQKQVDDRETETKSYPSTPRIPYEPFRARVSSHSPMPMLYEEERERRPGRRGCGLITTVLLMATAFLVGGGIGGGIGGSIAVHEKSRYNVLRDAAGHKH